MAQAQPASTFQTTRWSLVLAAPRDAGMLDDLLQAYWGPIFAYLRRCGLGPDEAADVTQGFIAQVVLERGLLDRADPERGRFRSLLKTALRNFIIDHRRREAARRGGGRSRPPAGRPLSDFEPHVDHDPGAAFDQQWATTLLSATLGRMAAECAACGQESHWSAFREVVIEPALGQSPPQPLADVARRIGVAGPEQISSMIQTMRRKFLRTLRLEVAQTVASPEEAEDELADLRRCLGL